MFERSMAKIGEVEQFIEQMGNAVDTQLFRSQFNACLSALRSITFALQSEDKHVSGFEDWYGVKQSEMRGDELLRFIHDSRNADVHQGRHSLKFTGAEIGMFETDKAGPPPADNSVMVIGIEGPYWIVDHGTPNERRVPIRQGGNWTIHVAIENPPKTHLGHALTQTNPITLCRTALEYFHQLVIDARVEFQSTGTID